MTDTCPPNNLLQQATDALTNAYAPYSNFPVGACFLGEDEQLYTGCNVENAASPEGLCAEAVAIGNMIANGCRKIKAALVIIPGKRNITPCGGCRQKLLEFCSKDTPIYLCSTEGKAQVTTISELMPLAFTKDYL